MRRVSAAFFLAAALWSAPAGSQEAGAPVAQFWENRLIVERRQADDREQRLIDAFDADRVLLLTRIGEISRARDVSQQALAAVAISVGVRAAREGQSLDLPALLEAIQQGAERVRELESRLSALEAGADSSLARQLADARNAINSGDLDGAESLLRSARRAARAAREGAQLREAEVIALEAGVNFLRQDWLAAASLYGEALEAAPQAAMESRWRYAIGRARALYERGERHIDPVSLNEAVRIYSEVALPLAPRDARPVDWAANQNDLGNCFRVLAERGAPSAFTRAAQAYEAALTVWTRESNQVNWAGAQMNLGTVYMRLGERGQRGAFERALSAYESALAAFPANSSYWADAQANMGNVLLRMGERGERGMLTRAVDAYEAALTVRTRTTDPSAWAGVQNSLGLALYTLGQTGEAGAHQRAIASYRAALEVTTREGAPAAWAMMQMNLGNALAAVGARGEQGALTEAVQAHEAALTVRTRQADPAGWAEVQYNLAIVCRRLGRYREARAAAQGALDTFQALGAEAYANLARDFLARLPPT